MSPGDRAFQIVPPAAGNRFLVNRDRDHYRDQSTQSKRLAAGKPAKKGKKGDRSIFP